jgi:hypothetical protein
VRFARARTIDGGLHILPTEFAFGWLNAITGAISPKRRPGQMPTPTAPPPRGSSLANVAQ